MSFVSPKILKYGGKGTSGQHEGYQTHSK